MIPDIKLITLIIIDIGKMPYSILILKPINIGRGNACRKGD